eukprot:984099-Pleurochrysis_carterae.AAC.1
MPEVNSDSLRPAPSDTQVCDVPTPGGLHHRIISAEAQVPRHHPEVERYRGFVTTVGDETVTAADAVKGRNLADSSAHRRERHVAAEGRRNVQKRTGSTATVAVAVVVAAVAIAAAAAAVAIAAVTIAAVAIAAAVAVAMVCERHVECQLGRLMEMFRVTSRRAADSATTG